MGIVGNFLTFDKLMGSALVKIVYFLGLIGIALGFVGGILSAFGLFFVNFGLGLGMLIAVPIGCIFALCFLRFACELYIVLFRMGDDINAMRNGGGLTQSINVSAPPSA
jgi:hypothetical protein